MAKTAGSPEENRTEAAEAEAEKRRGEIGAAMNPLGSNA
jgi:hypothetical protein